MIDIDNYLVLDLKYTEIFVSQVNNNHWGTNIAKLITN
jgi:hypothetical protein